MDEKVIETRTCRQCSAKFPITDRDMEFYAKVSPVFNGKKEMIPPPTLCPECRQRRRLAFRNERALYKRKCHLTGRDIISMYSPDKPYSIYNVKDWWSDKWDAFDYGREFDFSRSFFEQFFDLLLVVPRASVLQDGEMLNSEYANFCWWLKDCYLVNDSGKSENCFYGNMFGYAKNSMDCYWLVNSEGCYECIVCTNCYNLRNSYLCNNCSESFFLKNCDGCMNCFGCINLSNKKYHIFNEEFEPEKYKEKISELLNTRDIATRVKIFYLSCPHKVFYIKNSENCSGDFISDSKNIWESFDVSSSEDCKFCQMVYMNTRDCYDITSFWEQMSLSYELSASWWVNGKVGVHHCLFGAYYYYGWASLLYSIGLHGNCTNCFWCTELKGKSYCILNKQYTKDEYEKLVPKIIEHMRQTGEWGEFFSPAVSLFGYNETVAQEYFPLTREEALAQGFRWSDYEPPAPQVSKTIPANRLPDRIEDIPDDILNWAIVCEVSGKPFRIVKQELDFYRKHHLPIPHRHHDQRHLDRMSLRNPRKLHERKCDKCGVDMQTTYAPDCPEIVYCEQCYNKEIYG